jgi:hypothetical protein
VCAVQRAADSLRQALRNDALSDDRPSAAVARHGTELVGAAAVVDHRREQLNATLSAHAVGYNSRRCLCLRVLSVDALREAVLSNLSLRGLWAIRRVCREFLRWSQAECNKLSALPTCNQSAYGGISMVAPGSLSVFKLGAPPPPPLLRPSLAGLLRVVPA